MNEHSILLVGCVAWSLSFLGFLIWVMVQDVRKMKLRRDMLAFSCQRFKDDLSGLADRAIKSLSDHQGEAREFAVEFLSDVIARGIQKSKKEN